MSKQDDLNRIIESAERAGVEMDVEAAQKWLKAMNARANDHSVDQDESHGIFGHHAALLDFSPVQLARFREIGRIVEFYDEPGVVETALALSGSAAQNKVQSFPGDCDFFERINIIADSWNDACDVLARLMRDKALNRFSAETYQFIEAKFGNYPQTVWRNGVEHHAGSPISWGPDDISNGYMIVQDGENRPNLLRWDDVKYEPGWCKLDWIILDTERRSLANASNMLDVTWEAPDGTITPLDGYLDGYYQEVYLDAASHPLFSKLVKQTSPDMLQKYVTEMEKQVRKYTNATDGANFGKAAKRLYNVFRLTGRYQEAAYLRELFDEPAALLYQMNALLKTIQEATLPGSQISIDEIIDQTDDLIMSVIRVMEGAKEVEIVRHLLQLEHALLRHERGDELSPEVSAASHEVLQIVNNFFHSRLHAVPTIKAYIDELHIAHVAM